MRFLRRQTLNRRAVFDNTVYVDTNNSVIMGSRTALKVPGGKGDANYTAGGIGDAHNERPVSAIEGMIRYNESTEDIEAYQGGTWRSIRFRESGAITQQSLGVGDGDTVYYGPLNPAPPANSQTQNGYSWSGANLIVLVENVFQLHTTNYTVEQNPTLSEEIYQGMISRAEIINATTLYLNTALQTLGASGTTTTATITFATQPATPFSIGETITVTGMVPYEYNGEFTVTGSTASSVSYALASPPGGPGAQTVSGQVTASNTVWPGVDITGAIISGTHIAPGTTVLSYTTDDTTGAVLSIVLDTPITGTIAAGELIVIDQTTPPANGYYLRFSSPVPPGKIVTVLHGFDQ